MKRLLLILCTAGCSLDWGSLEPTDSGSDAAPDAGYPIFSSVCFLPSKDIGVYCANTTPDNHSWTWDQGSCNQVACPAGAMCSVYTDVAGMTELLMGTCE